MDEDWGFDDCLVGDYKEDDSPTSGEIIEHGDYRLSSALRAIPDYENNYVFLKERKKLLDVLPDAVPMDNIQSLLYFWGLCSRIPSSYSHGTLIHHVKKNELDRLDLNQIITLSAVEYEVVSQSRDISLYKDIGIAAIEKVKRIVPVVIEFIMSMLICVTLKNSIKSHRTTGGEQIYNIPGCTMLDDVMVCRIYDDLALYFTSDCIGIWEKGNEYWMPVQYYINAIDKIQERFNVLIYSALCEGLAVERAPSTMVVVKIIDLFDNHLLRSGNNGYNGVSNYEATLVGVLLSRDDQELVDNPMGFLNSLLSDVEEGDRKVLEQLVMIVKDLSEDEIADLHGLYRIWGHPIIEIEKGLEKLRSVALQAKIIDEEKSSMVGLKFKEIFYYNYRNKHGFYPNHRIVNNAGEERSYLLNCLKSNIQFSTDCTLYRLEDWKMVESKRNYAIPHSWNMIHRAKDKAISPSRSEVFNDLTQRGHIFNQDNRRGVLKLIRTRLGPMREFLEKVAHDGIPKDDCIIGLYPKERELKVKPRFFSLMSFTIRLFMTATEELIGDKILPLFPQITMCLNLLDMQKKMGKMTSSMADQSKTITYVVNMDFAKWNQQMRYNICESVFKEMDDLFGVQGLINSTHKIFKQCVIWLSSGELPTKPDQRYGVYPDGKVAWIGDESGKEGVRQKGWTIMTVCDILCVAEKFEAEIQLVGGGDNQVLTVTWSSRDLDESGEITQTGKSKIRKKMNEFMEALDNHFTSRGLPLKMSETWKSSSLFMYNKHMYSNGRPLRSVLKQVSRCFMFSNASIMTLSSVMNSLSTVLKAAAQKEFCLFPLITLKNLWGKICAIFFLEQHPLCFPYQDTLEDETIITRRGRKIKVNRDDTYLQDFYMNCLYLPSVLGGPGLINILGLMMRGFPDPLCEGLSFLKKFSLLLDGFLPLVSPSVKRMMDFSKGANLNYEKLVEDPQSVNHDAPQPSESTVRGLARSGLEFLTEGNNPQLMAVMNVLSEENQKEFYNDLASGEILAPKQLHEIAKASLYGYINSLLSRVDQTKTIRRMNESMKVIEPIRRAEWRYIIYLMMRGSMDHDIKPGPCMRIYGQQIRNYSWEKRVVGVTVPHPIEFLIMRSEPHPCNQDCIVVRKLNNVAQDNLTSSMGPCKPYLGSYTRERFRSTDIASAYGEEDILSRAVSIQKLIWWVYEPNSRMGKLVRMLFKSVTNADSDGLWVDPEMIKGSYDHRRKSDSNTHGGIPNFNYSMTSHFSLSTSTWTSHAKGGKNENIHFQACIIRCLFECCQKIMNGQMLNNVIHFHELCPSCIIPLDEYQESEIAPVENVTIPSIPGNPFVYLWKEDVLFDYDVNQRMIMSDKMKLNELSTTDGKEAIDLFPYMMSMMLLLSCVRQVTGISQSTYVIARGKGSTYKTMQLFKELAWIVINAGVEDITIRTLKPVLIYCDCSEGRSTLSQDLGINPIDDLEGDDNGGQIGSFISCIRDFEPQVLHRRRMLIMSLGSIRTQILLHRLSMDKIYSECSLCREKIIADYYDNRPDSAFMRISCEHHVCLDYESPVRLTLHFENVNSLTYNMDVEVPELYSRIFEGDVKQRDCSTREKEEWGEIYILDQAADLIDIQDISHMIRLELYNMNDPSIVLFSRLLSYDVLCAVVENWEYKRKCRFSISVDHLSRQPEMSILEKEKELESALGSYMIFIDSLPDIPGQIVLITDRDDIELLKKYPHPIRLACSRTLLRLAMGSGYDFSTLKYMSTKTGGLVTISYGTFKEIQDLNRIMVCPTIKPILESRSDSGVNVEATLFESKTNLVWGLRSKVRRYHFVNRYDFIVTSQRILRRISHVLMIKSISRRNMGIQEELVSYILSLLSHCEEGYELSGKIKKVRFLPRLGSIRIKWREYSISEEHKNIYLMHVHLLRQFPEWLILDHKKIRDGVNLLGQRSVGLNVVCT